MILLDIHALIWFASEKGLGRKSERIVEDALADDRLAVSAISFWENGYAYRQTAIARNHIGG